MKPIVIFFGVMSSLLFVCLANLFAWVIFKLTGESKYKVLVLNVTKYVVPGCIVLLLLLAFQI